jgi:hypothetical protein
MRTRVYVCVAPAVLFGSRFNPLLQRRVLLPGSMFPFNLLGKSLPNRHSFSLISFHRWHRHY